MSDAQLRELERAFRESSDLEDECAWLAARLRAGEVDVERVRIAARLGDAAATGVLDAAGENVSVYLDDWTGGLEALGAQGMGRALVAGLRAALTTLEGDDVQAQEPEILAALEAWLACPCDADAQRVRSAADGLSTGNRHGTRSHAHRVANAFAWTWEAVLALQRSDADAQGQVTSVLYQVSKTGADMRAAVRAAVVPWCLGV